MNRNVDLPTSDVLSAQSATLLQSSLQCNLEGSRLSGMHFGSLIEIAALGSGPLNLSYIWHVSPVSVRSSMAAPTTLPFCADASVCSTL